MHYNQLVPELNITNLAESLHFYTAILGFEIKYQRSNPDFAFIALNGAQLMLEEIQPDSWLMGELVRPFGRGMNLSIECQDIVATAANIHAAGISLFEELHEAWYATDDGEFGQRQLIVADPDGYLLRLTKEIGKRPIS